MLFPVMFQDDHWAFKTGEIGAIWQPFRGAQRPGISPDETIRALFTSELVLAPTKLGELTLTVTCSRAPDPSLTVKSKAGLPSRNLIDAQLQTACDHLNTRASRVIRANPFYLVVSDPRTEKTYAGILRGFALGKDRKIRPTVIGTQEGVAYFPKNSTLVAQSLIKRRSQS